MAAEPTPKERRLHASRLLESIRSSPLYSGRGPGGTAAAEDKDLARGLEQCLYATHCGRGRGHHDVYEQEVLNWICYLGDFGRLLLERQGAGPQDKRFSPRRLVQCEAIKLSRLFLHLVRGRTPIGDKPPGVLLIPLQAQPLDVNQLLRTAHALPAEPQDFSVLQRGAITDDQTARALGSAKRQKTFRCHKCKTGADVTYYAMQSRGADEPTSYICTCTGCKEVWIIR